MDEARIEVAQTGAAVLRRQGGVREAELVALVEDLLRELRVAVAPRGDRDDALARVNSGVVVSMRAFCSSVGSKSYIVGPSLPQPQETGDVGTGSGKND